MCESSPRLLLHGATAYPQILKGVFKFPSLDKEGCPLADGEIDPQTCSDNPCASFLKARRT